MDICDENIKALYRAACGAGRDLFISADSAVTAAGLRELSRCYDGGTLVLLPGVFAAFGGDSRELYYNRDSHAFERRAFPCFPGSLCFADVRLMGCDSFRAFLERCRFTQLIIPFAELADSSEYGYRESYAWIGEWRAAFAGSVHVTAIFSETPPEPDYFAKLFGCSDCYMAGADSPLSVRCAMTQEKNKYSLTAAYMQKYTEGSTAVLFTTRREAAEFCRRFSKGGNKILYADGALSARELSEILRKFSDGGTQILAATKSVLASSFFFSADRVVCCGVPYSTAHARRMMNLCGFNEILCIYSEADFRLNAAIISSAQHADAEPRIRKLAEIYYLLNDE